MLINYLFVIDEYQIRSANDVYPMKDFRINELIRWTQVNRIYLSHEKLRRCVSVLRNPGARVINIFYEVILKYDKFNAMLGA